MKLCKNCKNLSAYDLGLLGKDFVKCLHHMAIYRTSPVDGTHERYTAEMFRANGGTFMPTACGPEAKYYDPRT